ncbi:MAG TPA: hypothetical protein VI386_30135 [Candidatus Sulfotelmatobacter sp.]
MAPANDKDSERNSTLPLPELNPLLNPVLAAHMGRWAEVYFTSPPEKREEAVLELLHELQGGVPTPQQPSRSVENFAIPETRKLPSEPQPARQTKSEPVPLPVPLPEPDWVLCESCGGRNPMGNRFCGMCGAPLAQDNSVPFEPVSANKERSEPPAASQDFREEVGQEFYRQHSIVPENRVSQNHRDTSVRKEPEPFSTNWPSRPDVPSLIPEYEPVLADRRRIYIGLAIAILIAGLLFYAWRGSKDRAGASHSLPQPTPAASEPVIDQPAASAALQKMPPPPPRTESRRAPGSAPSVPKRAPMVAVTQSPRRPDTAPPAGPAPPQRSTSDQTSGPIVASLHGNGSEELTVAESYLNGTHGRARDTSEAAKWLWRSFGKKNASAALLLSDLYVQGDGVPKSCDQARLLLDAAARNSAPGAAERIRNLPSVGCQ